MKIKTYQLENIKAVILVGDPDFGRCKLATRLNRALWPIAGRPVLQRLIEHIANQGIQRFVICCSIGAQEVQAALDIPDYLDVEFQLEQLPRGTAGCIRDAADPAQDELIFVFPAALLTPPDLHELITAHRDKMGIMTIFFKPSNSSEEKIGKDAQIYICEPEIMNCIPSQGYSDLKENLVPTLVQKGETIAYGTLDASAGNYRHWSEYIRAVQQYVLTLDPRDPLLGNYHRVDSEENIWAGENVKIDPSARIIGPVLIEENTTIGPDVLLIGPTLIGSEVEIHPEAVISESIVWKKVIIGTHCRIQRCLVDEQKVLFSSALFNNQLITSSTGYFPRILNRIKKPLVRAGHRIFYPKVKSANTLSSYLSQTKGKVEICIVFLLVMGCLLAAYWNPTLIELWKIWMESDEYSSGLLVPLLAGYIIWDRRKELVECPIRPVPWAVCFLLLAQTLRPLGLLIWSPSMERLSLMMTIAILIWIILGFQFVKKIFPIWLYLILMFPIPTMLEWKVTVPLQKWASVSAVFCLETLGFRVIREGNIININGILVAVAEACNGLRMLTAFFVVTGFVILLSRRKLWEKVLILLSSVPIALLCNTIRLTLTSIAFLYLETETWEKAFHDYGGLAMMPLALGITLLELWFLSKLFIGPDTRAVQSLNIITKK